MKHTIEELKAAFTYSEESPSSLIRNSTGKVAGSLRSDKRWNVTLGKKNYQGHRLVYAIVTGDWPKLEIDHIDGDPSNNNIANLRDVTATVNMHNRRAKGYYFHKLSGKYQCQTVINGKWINLGLYEDEELAAFVADEAKIKFYNPPIYSI